MILLIFASLIGDLLALSFGIFLIFKKQGAAMLAKYATPFAAGALLAAAFVDLLPDVAREGNLDEGLVGALIGILIFFLLERFVHWIHHHRDENESQEDRDAIIPLIVIGNLLHRAIDGVAIATGFLTSDKAGLIVTVAVVIHEIPHTVGDFAMLLYKGLSRVRVIMINISVAGLTTLMAAVLYLIGERIQLPLGFLLGLTAGFFIYIAVSDIIPDIHIQEDRRFVGLQSILLISGTIMVSGLIELVKHLFGSV